MTNLNSQDRFHQFLVVMKLFIPSVQTLPQIEELQKQSHSIIV